MIQVWKFNSDGYFIESTIIKEEEKTSNMTTIPLLTEFIKAKFNSAEWVEGATTEEIAEWKEQNTIPSKLTENEMLMLALADLDIQRMADKLETDLAIAELAEVLLGGI